MTIAFLGLACFLTWATWTTRHILMGVCAFLTWFGEAMWLFFSAVPLFNFAELHTQLLAWVFFIMAFVPLLLLMDYQITKEKDGQKWTEWGARPKDKETNYERYKAELQRRTRR